MSAMKQLLDDVPKPKVCRVQGVITHPDSPDYCYFVNSSWTWSCRCGAGQDLFVTLRGRDFQASLRDATQHSRTHTAEKMVAQLEEWAGEPSSDTPHDCAYWTGYLNGAAEAQREVAALIRANLVEGAP